ncbi:MAG TPA: di-heme-cytochrome C peroxidase, partial [Acetobacteraceae bacterium]
MRKRIAAALLAAMAGCTTPAPPPAPPEASTLDQNWSDAQRRWFYHTSQGTKLMPYGWFLALEQPSLSLTGAPPFSAPDNLARFGFLPDTPSANNPDGLPVGFAPGWSFVEDTTEREPVVGLTCAACHTGQIEYRRQAVRIDGGPAMTNTGAFQTALGEAMVLTYLSPLRFERFARKVLGREYSPEAQAQLFARFERGLKAGQAEQGVATKEQLYPVAEGPGRLDALGRGANFVFGTLAQDRRNFAVADAPVSYPAIWEAPWHDWVQYNGSIRQPMARNVAEAMGVRSVVKLSGPPENQFQSTVRVDEIHEMEALLAGPAPGQGLRAPRWPEAVLGPIDATAAE